LNVLKESLFSFTKFFLKFFFFPKNLNIFRNNIICIEATKLLLIYSRQYNNTLVDSPLIVLFVKMLKISILLFLNKKIL